MTNGWMRKGAAKKRAPKAGAKKKVGAKKKAGKKKRAKKK